MVAFSQPDPRAGVGSKAGTNTTAVLYYRKGSPFNNLCYQAEDIVRADGVNADFDGQRNSDGYPTTYGTATTHIEWYIMSNLEGEYPAGNYVLTWSGGGAGTVKPSLTGKTPTVDEANRRVYSMSEADFAGARSIRILVADIDSWGTGNYAGDPITDVQFSHEDYEGTCGYGEADFLRQDYIDAYSKFTGGLRVMNMMATNQQDGNTAWANRRPTTYRTFSHGAYDDGTGRHTPAGAPLPVVIEIVNTLGVPGWFNIPHAYDDSSITAWAQYLVDNYDHSLGPPAVEWSNECWNSTFIQEDWCQTEGLAEDAATESSPGAGDGRYGGDSFPLFAHAGFRSSQAMQLVKAVFDTAGKDFCAVLGVQTGNTGAALKTLQANTSEPFSAVSAETPADHHDSVCVSGYVGGKILREPFWSSSGAKDDGDPVPGTTENTINWDPDITKMWDHFDYMLDTFHPGSSTTDAWAKSEAQITAEGFSEILCYEGNHHVVREFGGGAGADGLAWAQTLVDQYETETFQSYHRKLMRVWHDIFGDGCYMHFVLVADNTDDDGYWSYYPDLPTAVAEQADGTYKLAESMRLVCGHSCNRSP